MYEDSLFVVEDSRVVYEDSLFFVEDSRVVYQDSLFFVEDSRVVYEDWLFFVEDSRVSVRGLALLRRGLASRVRGLASPRQNEEARSRRLPSANKKTIAPWNGSARLHVFIDERTPGGTQGGPTPAGPSSTRKGKGGERAAEKRRGASSNQEEDVMALYVHVELVHPNRNGVRQVRQLRVDAPDQQRPLPEPHPHARGLQRAHRGRGEGGRRLRDKVPGTVTARKEPRGEGERGVGHLRDYVQLVVESQVGAVDLNAIRAMAESAGMRLRKVTPRPKLVLGAAPARPWEAWCAPRPRAPCAIRTSGGTARTRSPTSSSAGAARRS